MSKAIKTQIILPLVSSLIFFSATRGLATEVPAQFIAEMPLRYQSLDAATRDLLARSVLSKKLLSPDSRTFNGRTLWQFLDQKFSPSELEALVQTRQAAQDQGLGNAISELREVYAGTSWGIKFYGPDNVIAKRVHSNDFCHDMDSIVRREHGNTAHTWWRQLSSVPGLGSLHLGLSAGAGYHDLHFDTTNPATGRGSFGSAELCNYSVTRVIAHNVDIHSNRFSSELRDFLQLELLGYFQRRLKDSLTVDLKYCPVENRSHWPELLDLIQQSNEKQTELSEAAMTLATRLDGITRFRLELASDVQKQSVETRHSLSSFLEILLTDSLDLQTPEERSRLMTYRDRLMQAGPYALDRADVDWIVGAFMHLRKELTAQ